MGKYFIGVDSGTQSTKTIIVDGKTGKVLGSASQAYELIQGLPAGAKEQHPEDWITAVKATIAKALKVSKVNPRDVAAIGVSGQQHGFVPIDAKGQVIRPAKLWCDTETSPQADKLIKKLGGIKKTIALTGNSIPAGFTASKILWLKENEPAGYRQLDCVLLPHDYINFWLTGERVMEYGEASGTALMNVRKRQWCKEVVQAIDPQLMNKLPRLQSSDKPAGLVRPEVAKEFGFGSDVIVSAGGGDNMMGAIGTRNVEPGCVTASFGTSGTIYAYSAKPVIDPEGQIAAFCDSTGAWMPLLCTMNVTVATEMIKKCYGWTNEKLAVHVAKIAPGADGLLLVPYLEGERTPNVPDGTGIYFGVNTRTCTPAHFARAAMEGVTLGMNYGLNRLRTLGIGPKEIRITGGGANSPVWRQIMADVFGCPVVCLETGEGAAFGGALQAMWCYELSQGRQMTIQTLCRKFVRVNRQTLVKPIARNVAIYRHLQSLQDGFATDCAGLFSSHRKLLGMI